MDSKDGILNGNNTKDEVHISNTQNDQDEIVKEVDIFLSPSDETSLILNQYPLRPAHITDFRTPNSVKFKKKCQKLELQLHLDPKSSNYDQARGELIQANVIRNTEKKNLPETQSQPRFTGGSNFERHVTNFPLFPAKEILNSVFTTQTLASSIANGNNINSYTIGIMQNGELHLKPINVVFQMRPNISYLDSKKIDPAAKPGTSGGYSSHDESEAEAPKVETVRVKFARPETEATKKRRENSYYHQEKIANDEDWLKLKYSGCFTSEAVECKTKVVKEPQNQSDMKNIIPKEDLIYSILEDANKVRKSESPEKDLENRVVNLLKRVHVASVEKLMKLLNISDESSLLDLVQKIAVLVRGWWVIKSENLYADRRLPAVADIELLSRARDLALHLLSTSKCVSRKEIQESVPLTNEDATFILLGISKHNKKGWAFPFPDDNTFIHSHPEIAQKQKFLFDARWKKLEEIIAESKMARNLPPQLGKSKQKNRTRTLSSRSIGSSDGEFTSNDASQPPRRRRKSSAVNGITIIKSTLGQESVTTSDLVKENHDSNPVNRLVYELLCEKKIVTMQETINIIQTKIGELPISDAQGISKTVSEEQILTIIKKMDAHVYQSNKGIPPVLIYGGSESGSHPEIRSFLAKYLVEQKQSFRLNSFKQVCPKLEINNEELKKVISDYCTCKKGVYTLIGS